MGRGAKTTEFLKMCLSDALIQLMEEKTFDSITIDEIVSAAGVGRATYFRNFKSKEELISFKMDMLLKNWFTKNRRSMDLNEGIRFVLEFYYVNKDFFLPVYKDKKGAEILDMLHRRFFPQLQSIDTDYKESFYFGGIIGVFGKWLKCGFKETPAEIMDILYSLEDDTKRLIERTYSTIEINSETGMPELYLRTNNNIGQER